jgi:hypothetical protein
MDSLVSWETDADLFGRLQNNDKWFKAHLAARCVEVSENQAHVKSDMKTSAGSFASRSL